MKILYNYLFFLYYLCSFFSLSCIQDLNPLQLIFIIKTQENRYPLSEGFDSKTLVKTPNGYIIIKDLKVSDYIVNNDNQLKKIISIGKRLATQWIEFEINNENFCVGYNQFLYIPQQKSFIAAKNILQPHTAFGSINTINSAKKVMA